MTLILAANVGSKFCVTTGDTLTAYTDVHEETINGKTTYAADPSTKELTKNGKKVHIISRYVTWAHAGVSNITMALLKELKKRVRHDEELADCALILGEIIEEKRKSNDDPFIYQYLDKHDSFGILLNGFDQDGRSGFTYYIPGEFNGEVVTTYTDPGEYEFVIWSPTGDFSEHKEEMFSTSAYPNEQGLVNVTSHLIKIHALIQPMNPEVISEICDLRIMYWHEELNRPAISSGSFDITALSNLFGLSEEIETLLESSEGIEVNEYE